MSAGTDRSGSGTESSVAVTRGRGRPVSACSGPCGGRRPAAGCRGRAHSVRMRRSGPQGNELQVEPGDLDRRAGRGDPLTGQDSGSPRVRTSPVAAGDVMDGIGQPVARERSGGPPGLTPGTATAPRGTGGIPRAPADDAGPRGRSATAGEDAAGWIVGVLGISRSTTGRSSCGRDSGEAGPPQARYFPPGPEPQSASLRTRDRNRTDRRGADGASGVATGGGAPPATDSPRGPPPPHAPPRGTPGKAPTG